MPAVEQGDNVSAVSLDTSTAPREDYAEAARLLQRIENVPFSRWHTKARLIMGSATFFDAFDALSLAFAMPVLVRLWHLSPGEIGGLIATGYAGQFIGAIAFGWLAERIGRVPTISIAVAIASIMSIGCALSGTPQTLLFVRFVQGIGLGGEVPTAAAYINELSRAKGRGRFFILYEIVFPLGLLTAAQIGSIVVPRLGWESIFLLGGVPGFIILFFMLRLPESPRWLIGRARYREADGVIQKIEGAAIKMPPTQSAEDAQAQVERLEHGLRQSAAKRPSWKELFSAMYRPRTLIVWVLWACAYFVANGVSNWLPTLYRTVYHLPLKESLRLAATSNVLSTCAVLCCALLVDRVGRRRWAMGTFIVGGALLAVLAAVGAHSYWSVLVLASSAYAVMGTTTVLLYLYTPEIYPTRMRALGTGMATSWLRVASATAPALVGFVLPRFGIASIFAMFAVVAAIGLVAATRMFETTNRELEEISP